MSLLDTARRSESEQTALQHIADATQGLFADLPVATAIYEQTADGLRRCAFACEHVHPADTGTTPVDSFAALVIGQARTAALDDAALRPDLALPRIVGPERLQAALGAPIRAGDAVSGAFVVYGLRAHQWSEEQFQVAEWLADQCGRILQALRVQSELRDADRRKDEFLATLSHELRNPLAPIRFALKLIEKGEVADGQAVQIIQRQFKQLVRLVDDLLDATRLSRNKVQIRRSRVDLASLIRLEIDGARPDIEGMRHRVTVDVPPDPVWIDADPDRMSQVVTNLLTNAIRYTPAGGEIRVALTRAGADALIVVADSGIGLAAGDTDRVFEMFTQVAGPGSGGLGIGLALVRGIVELHGGQVDAHSDGPGAGTTFTVRVPATMAAEVEPADTGSVAPACTGRRVLVVDDNADAASLLATLLELHGHRVWVEHRAETALLTATRVTPDVALLDIGLPDISGYDLARRLRQEASTCHMRLVAVTGFGQAADRTRARDAGFDAHLTKPAEPDAILAVL
ncbi:MAG: ATP-binding protein [Vicinamibacterales bacterium]